MATAIPLDPPDPPVREPKGRAAAPSPAQLQGGGEDEPALNLQMLLEVLQRRKILILVIVAVVTTLAAIYVSQLTPRFSAEAQVIVEGARQRVVDIDVVAQGISDDRYTNETQAAIIGSREIAAQVVDRLNLTEHPLFVRKSKKPGFFGAAIKTIKGFVSGAAGAVISLVRPRSALLSADAAADALNDARDPDEEAREFRNDIIDYIQGGIDAQPSERSRVISISYSSTDPDFAALMANTVAEVYILDQLNRKTESTRQATAWLDTRVEELRQRVVETKRRLEEFRRDSGFVEIKGTSILQEQMAGLQVELSKARTSRAEAEARAAQVDELLRSDGGIETAAAVLDSLLIQRLREQEATVVRKIAELRTQLRDGHPRLALAVNALKELRESIRNEVQKIVRNLENEAELARLREANLNREIEDVQARIDSQNESEVTIRSLESEVDANQRLYETMLSRLKETRIQDDTLQQADARIISRAVVPRSPYFPKKRALILLAFVVSLGVGVFAAFVVEYLDAGFRTASQVESMTGLPVIGVLPVVGRTRRGKLVRRAHEIAVERPNSVFGEAVRSLRTGLALSNVDHPPRTVLVCSAVPQEGKSSVALSIACSAAKSGQRTIIVDCDLRSPRIHEYLGLPNETGLTDFLMGAVTLEQALEFDPKSGVHVLAAGRHAPNPPDMLGSMHMFNLMRRLGETYDLVVFDTPPLLAVSDSLILGRAADKVVFVARWAKTRRDSSIIALRQLLEAGADVAGVVLSQVDTRQHASYEISRTGHYFDNYHKYYSD